MKLSEWFTDESKWCQQELAVDDLDFATSCSLKNPRLCSMCLYGATYATAASLPDFNVLVEKIRAIIGQQSIGTWNDSPDRTFDDILNVVREVEAC